jgi:hypothetical protein
VERLSVLKSGSGSWKTSFGFIPTDRPLDSTTLNELFYGS